MIKKNTKRFRQTVICYVVAVSMLLTPVSSFAASDLSDGNQDAFDISSYSLNYERVTCSNDERNAVPLDATEDVLNPNDYGTKYKNTEQINGAEIKSIGSALIKKAIKFILKNHKEVVPIIEKLGGKRAAKAFSKHFNKISPQLENLLKWSDIPYQAVHDAVYRGLINAGVSRSTATKAALALKEGLSWLL